MVVSGKKSAPIQFVSQKGSKQLASLSITEKYCPKVWGGVDGYTNPLVQQNRTATMVLRLKLNFSVGHMYIHQQGQFILEVKNGFQATVYKGMHQSFLVAPIPSRAFVIRFF